MQVLISMDMEGVAGIATRKQIISGNPNYELARVLMTAEATAAAVGSFEGGASEVLINDAHGFQDNLIAEQLDPRVQFTVGQPKPLGMVSGISTKTAVVLFLGYHVGPADIAGVLGHSFSGAAFSDLRLNGEPLTELLLNALLAAHFGVPVGLVTGDDATCRMAQETLPGVHTLAVKEALGHGAALSQQPATARKALSAAAAAVVRAAQEGKFRPLAIPKELVLEAQLRQIGAAELAVKIPGTERVGPGSVRRVMRDPSETYDVIGLWSGQAASIMARNA